MTLLASADERRAAPADRYIPPTRRSAANLPHAAAAAQSGTDGQTDGQTDPLSLHRNRGLQLGLESAGVLVTAVLRTYIPDRCKVRVLQ